MAVIIQKYGGSSLADLERIRHVAANIIRAREKGDQICVVVSAMKGETDRLLHLARAITRTPPGREQDALVSTGEQVSAALLAITLDNAGCPARSFLGLQLPLITNQAHTRARIREVSTKTLRLALDEGCVAVVAGFQGVDEQGDITTLGRGGSDTTAVALAAVLQAAVCEIYTDVDGVYTADPGVCPKAGHLQRITYEEMMELASLGTKVLQIRSVELARKFRVPLLVKSSYGGARCTWVVEEGGNMENAIISGVTLDRSEAKLSVLHVPDRPGIAFRILDPLAGAAISVDMIIQNISRDGSTDFTFTIPKADLPQAKALVQQVAAEIGAAAVREDDAIAKVSAVGIGMKNHPGVAARMFRALADENINIQMISTSEIRISCVVNARYGELAVRVIHDAFGLGEQGESSIFKEE